MSDYLALAKNAADAMVPSVVGSVGHESFREDAKTYALVAIAERLTGTTDEVTQEPSYAATEALGELMRWRAADRLFDVESVEWWDATARLRDVADRLGGVQ